MTETVSHVLFDRAKSNKGDSDKDNAFKAIDITSDEAYITPVEDPDKEEVYLECHCNDPCKDEINVLEIAFFKGKLRRTKFAVDYIDKDEKKHHIGTYESKGETNSYEKFLMPDKIKGLKGLVITFKGNSDRSPWFAVKGIRLAKYVEKTL